MFDQLFYGPAVICMGILEDKVDEVSNDIYFLRRLEIIRYYILSILYRIHDNMPYARRHLSADKRNVIPPK